MPWPTKGHSKRQWARRGIWQQRRKPSKGTPRPSIGALLVFILLNCAGLIVGHDIRGCFGERLDSHSSSFNATGVVPSRAWSPRQLFPSVGSWTIRQPCYPLTALCDTCIFAAACGGTRDDDDYDSPCAHAATAGCQWLHARPHLAADGDGVLGPLLDFCAALWAGTWHGTLFLSCLLDPAAIVAAGQHWGQLALPCAAPGPLRRRLSGDGRGSLRELQRGTACADCGAAVAAVSARPSPRAIRASCRIAYMARFIGRARRAQPYICGSCRFGSGKVGAVGESCCICIVGLILTGDPDFTLAADSGCFHTSLPVGRSLPADGPYVPVTQGRQESFHHHLIIWRGCHLDVKEQDSVRPPDTDGERVWQRPVGPPCDPPWSFLLLVPPLPSCRQLNVVKTSNDPTTIRRAGVPQIPRIHAGKGMGGGRRTTSRHEQYITTAGWASGAGSGGGCGHDGDGGGDGGHDGSDDVWGHDLDDDGADAGDAGVLQATSTFSRDPRPPAPCLSPVCHPLRVRVCTGEPPNQILWVVRGGKETRPRIVVNTNRSTSRMFLQYCGDVSGILPHCVWAQGHRRRPRCTRHQGPCVNDYGEHGTKATRSCLEARPARPPSSDVSVINVVVPPPPPHAPHAPPPRPGPAPPPQAPRGPPLAAPSPAPTSRTSVTPRTHLPSPIQYSLHSGREGDTGRNGVRDRGPSADIVKEPAAVDGHGAENQAASVLVHAARGFGLLELRGGGRLDDGDHGGQVDEGCVRAPAVARALGPRVPGGGVLQWLLDEDGLEAWELAELERRRTESAVMVDADADARDAARHVDSAVGHPASESRRFTIITGQRDQDSVYVCMCCMRDHPLTLNGWTSCGCGTPRCLECASSRCAKCGLLGTMSLSLEAAVEPPSGIGWGTSCTREAFSRRTLDYHHGLSGSPYPATDGGEVTSDGTTGLLHCARCGAGSLRDCAQWHVCRCGNTICAGCAGAPCLHCGTLLPHSVIDLSRDQPVDVASHVVDSDHLPQFDPFDDVAGSGVDDCDFLGTDIWSSAASCDVQAGTAAKQPTVITPAQALVERNKICDAARQKLDDRRARGRQLRKDQVRRGLRPPRDRGRTDGITLVQANVTAASSWEEELRHGDLFNNCDFAGVQEHVLIHDRREIAKRKLLDAGWDCIVDEPYFKSAAHGGGTGIMAARWSGVRPLGELGGEAAEAMARLRGRLSAGVIAVVGGVLLLSFYGLDGQKPCKQVPLLRDMGRLIKLVGLPFIVLGDWQILPSELAATGWPHIMGAEVVAPAAPTNVHSRRCIDYAVMSAQIAALVQDIEVVCGTRFTPHAPVRIKLACPRSLGNLVRLVQPKLYPAEKPDATVADGELLIDWSGWIHSAKILGDAQAETMDADVADELLQQWYAGADMELRDLFGHSGKAEEASFMGIGRPPVAVEGTVGPRRRGTPDVSGILGHRLAFAANTFHVALIWFGHPPDSCRLTLPQDAAALRGSAALFRSMLHRAGAFRRELTKHKKEDDDVDEWLTLETALCLLETGLGIDDAGRVRVQNWVEKGLSEFENVIFKYAEGQVAAALTALTTRRRRNTTRSLRAWAAAAPLKVAHAATRSPETATAYSASPLKTHYGERTGQLAADHGIAEWASHWLADDADIGDKVVARVKQIVAEGPSPWFVPEDGRQEPLVLPPIDDLMIERCSLRSKSNTGIGHDNLRLRHVAWLSRGAKKALAALLMIIEKLALWPEAARGTVAVALTKKTGGGRV